MPLQNRVTPFGEIVASPDRGTMMGNRGVLHDDDRRIVRPWQVKRWIACVLEFRGRHRQVMSPHRYTELFFLDEAAAFAAGHRPCRECRYADYQRFRGLWQRLYGGTPTADAIDLRLHAERLERKTKRTYRAAASTLPDGTFVALDAKPWLLWQGALREWSGAGYVAARTVPGGEIEVLTPRSIVEVIASGYRPSVHPSLGF